jgi:hypothetical protein
MTFRDVFGDRSRSTDLEIVRGLFTAITDNLIFDRLTFIDGAKAGTFDSGDVNELPPSWG